MKHVEHRGEPEEEGEPLHLADGQPVEEDSRQERDEVGRQHGPERALEPAVDARSHGPARARLVFQAFEIDDVRVDRDPDRDDDAGHAGQVEARRHARVAEGRDDRPQQCAGDREAAHHHDAEQPVVEDRVQEHQDQPGDAGAEAGVERGSPEGRRHRLGGQLHQPDRQRAVVEGQCEVVGRRIGEAARDLDAVVEGGEGGSRRAGSTEPTAPPRRAR